MNDIKCKTLKINQNTRILCTHFHFDAILKNKEDNSVFTKLKDTIRSVDDDYSCITPIVDKFGDIKGFIFDQHEQ